jgi:hypothetical protein
VVVEKIPEEAERELAELRKKQSPAIPKFAVQFESLVNNFKYLLGVLAEIKEGNAGEYERYRNAANQLIGKMAERL